MAEASVPADGGSLEEPQAKRARFERMGTEAFDDEPCHMQELLAWPSQVADTMVDACHELEAESNLRDWFDMQAIPVGPKLFVTTHYTGLGTVEHCIERHRAVDFVLQECSSFFNTEEAFRCAFPPPEFRTHVVKLKCEDVGVPMIRWRNYSWTINTETVELEKPINRENFLQCCSSSPCLDGHSFFIAPQWMIQDHLRAKLLKVKGVLCDPGAVLPMDIALDVGSKLRLEDYQRLLGSPDILTRKMVGVVDLSQNVCVRQRLSTNLPSFLCQSCIWSQWHGRMMLPLEMMVAMGWPISGLAENPIDSPWTLEYLSKFRSSEIVKMTGNQMHCRVVGSFLAYCLAMTKPRQKLLEKTVPDSIDEEIRAACAEPDSKPTGTKRGRPKKRCADEAEGTDKQALQAKPQPKKRAKHGVQSCKGCKKKISAEQQATNFPGCVPCKRALDNITKLASRQGEQAVKFVREQREDPDKCFAMVQSYFEVCPECEPGAAKNKKRGSWSIVKYQERIVAASGFVKDKVGEMMGKKLYLEFAQTIRGGRKTDDQAAAQWAEWESRLEAGDKDLFFDHMGENGSLRFWIHTGDEVRFRTSYLQEKAVTMDGESKKNGSQEDVDRLKKKVTSKHDPIADQIQICQAIVRNGEAAFQGQDGFLVDVMELAQIAEKVKDQNPDEENGVDGNGKSESETSPEKVKPWVDRDRVVSSTMRSCDAQIKVFKLKCQQGLSECKEKLEGYQQSKDADFQKTFAGEIKLLENRVEEKNDEDEVKAYIARFAGVTASEEVLDAAVGANPVELGKEVTAEIAAIRSPLAQLLAATTRAQKSVKSAVDQLAKREAKQQAAASKAKKADEANNATNPLFDQGAAAAKAIPRVAPGPGVTLEVSKPFCVSAATWVSDFMGDGKSSRKEVDGFKDGFDAARAKSKGTRISKAFAEDENMKEVTSYIASLFKDSNVMVPAENWSDALKSTLVLGMFGIDVGYDKASSEFLGTATCRITLEGTRVVMMTEMLQLHGFMQRKGVTAANVGKMSAFFRSMSVSVLQEFQKECTLWTCTVGQGDCLFAPYVFLVAERVQQNTIGIRVPVLCKSSSHDNSLVALKKKADDLARELNEGASLPEAEKKKVAHEKALVSDLTQAIQVSV
ncbi:Putative WD repeat-containing protein C25H1.08c [Durusdinium trenchii]|uniref:WD repeat-containing protein C25H1.08c n=1 Tax=Durusdinium trenchii TaxID=1381693 RepID=A0ABP0PFD1_9DINO